MPLSVLSQVVAHEKPDLDATRQKLVVQIAADKSELDRLEALILQLLAESSPPGLAGLVLSSVAKPLSLGHS